MNRELTSGAYALAVILREYGFEYELLPTDGKPRWSNALNEEIEISQSCGSYTITTNSNPSLKLTRPLNGSERDELPDNFIPLMRVHNGELAEAIECSHRKNQSKAIQYQQRPSLG